MRQKKYLPTHQASERFVQAALKSDDSLFSPGEKIWSLSLLEEFHRLFVERPDLSSDSFLEKFRRQLDGASDKVLQLAAELLWVHFLTPTGTGGDKKREIINEVLSWMRKPRQIPKDLEEALDHGFVRGGFAFTTQRPYQLCFLIEFALHWKQLPEEEQRAALSDPWRFREIAWDVPVDRGHSQREALLYLVHPDTFEDTISRDALEKIANYFSNLVDDPTVEIHRQVLQIRKRLADEYGSGFGFFDPKIRQKWSPDNSLWGKLVHWMRLFFDDAEFDQEERNYKLELGKVIELARAEVTSGSVEWVKNLKRALKHPQNNITPWQMLDDFLNWAADNQQEASVALSALWTGPGSIGDRVDQFAAQIPKKAMRAAAHGRATLASYFLMGEDPFSYPPYRYQAFRGIIGLVDFEPLPKKASAGSLYEHALVFLDKMLEEAESRGLALRDRLDAQGLLWCIHRRKKKPVNWTENEWSRFLSYRKSGAGDDEGAEFSEDEDLDALAGELLLEPSYLQRIVDLLKHQGQVIFMGPPGTGKTFVARKLARVLAGSQERVTLVQFHPSYAYEDFVEGYRPTLIENRQPGFKIVQGPLRQIAHKAAAEPSQTFVLVIDEINRANLAKVLGELYFLLEYRSDEIRLQYSDEPFSLPENLWIIGTMNTADRSIALVDVALRRRFHFFRFFPGEPPLQGLLERWLKRHHPDLGWLAGVLERANEKLDDPNFAIGPSHFMDKDLLTESWIEMIWEHSVLPFIDEYFFGEPDRTREFDLKRLREDVQPDAALSSTSASEPREEIES